MAENRSENNNPVLKYENETNCNEFKDENKTTCNALKDENETAGVKSGTENRSDATGAITGDEQKKDDRTDRDDQSDARRGKIRKSNIVRGCIRIALIAFLVIAQIWVICVIALKLKEYAPLVFSLFELGAVVAVIFMLDSFDSPSCKVAWTILILLVPFIGILIYLMWGRVDFSKRERGNLEKAFARGFDELEQDMEVFESLREAYPHQEKIAGYLLKSGFPVYDNTAADYYPLADDWWLALLEDIQNAKKFIFIESFIITDGIVWRSIYEALCAKTAQGLDVRIMYDDFGSLMTIPRNDIEKMKSANIKIAVFNDSIRNIEALYLNYRNHQKIAVIDGIIAHIGGANIADEYANLIPKHGHWKDTCLRMQGEAVWGFTVIFLQMWDLTKRELTKDYYEFRWNLDGNRQDENSLYANGLDENGIDTDSTESSDLGFGYMHSRNTDSSGLNADSTVQNDLDSNRSGANRTGQNDLDSNRSGADRTVQNDLDSNRSDANSTVQNDSDSNGSHTNGIGSNDLSVNATAKPDECGFFQPFSDGPANSLQRPAKDIYKLMISAAERYCYFTSPYLVLDDDFLNDLCLSARCGVDVRIILPKIPDHWYVHMVARSFYGRLIESGVKIYEYLPGFMHAKMVVSDDVSAVIGSINLDFRSFYMHYENAAWICGAPEVIKIRDDILDTIESCERIDLKSWKSRPVTTKVIEKILRMFSPLM